MDESSILCGLRNFNPPWGMKKDCFGYVSGKNCCSVLTENVCETRKCSFYMNKTEYRRRMLGEPEPIPAPESKRGRKGKPVRCVETGEVFPSCAAASKAMGLPKVSVYSVAEGVQGAVKGYHFTYIETEESK